MLTLKQQQNRRYYAKHAEKIRAKKREQYHGKPVAANPCTPKPVAAQKPQTMKDKMSARQKIEDRAMMKELGLI